MHKLLIPLLVCLTATLVHAQVPSIINFSSKPVPASSATDQPDGACSAGTFTLGQFVGKSNDHDLDTIYLCLGDSIKLEHNGDQVFMDPDPATAPGIGYAFYKCPPTATGDEITVKGDPCLWPGAGNGFFAVTSSAAGSPWFFNNGALIASNNFGMGNPLLITYAPITITDFLGGKLEPGCVDVNTKAAFSVIYLKEITESGISVNFGDDCKGKFRLRGGYPEWDNFATYKVSISLASDPNVKALIYTPPAQMKHGNDIIFSVPQAGVYNVLVVDGKSCDHMFQINMNVCAPANNVTVALPEVVSPPGSHVCVPITLNNFTDIFGTSFSLAWDPTILIYDSIHNANPAFGVFDPANNLNTQNVSLGNLGIIYFDNSFPPKGVTIPAGQTMVEVCFTVVGPLGSCTPLDVVSFPTLVTMDNIQGQSLAVTIDTGQVCADFVPLKVEFGVGPLGCSDASLSSIITGGIGPYQITWTNQATGTAGVTFANLPDTILTLPQVEGVYTVCVADDNGNGTKVCDTVAIDIPSLGATLVLVQSPTCSGAMDGAVRADVSVDGVILPFPVGPSFNFAWSPASLPATQEQNGVKAGPYVVTVTDPSNGCTAVASGTLTEPAVLNASNIQITPASCSGVADGAISVTVTGGTAFANNDYFFSWEYSPNANGMPLFTDESGNGNPFSMTNKPAGKYTYTITDANGCSITGSVDLTNARTVTVDLIKQTDPTCTGLSNGSIEAQINAQPAFNNPSYLFFWTSVPAGGPYPQANNGNSSVLSGLPAKQYQLLALDVTTGCSDTASFTLKDPPQLDVTITPTDPTCVAPSSGSAKAVSTGGTGPAFTYTWASNPAVTIPLGANATGLAAGTYTVTVKDANGCLDSATVQLKLPPPPAITAVDSTSVKCGSDGSLTVTAPTATSFTWKTLAGNTIGQTATVTGLPGDTYVITIKDAKSCVNMDTFTLAAVVPMSFLDTSFIEPTCFGGMDGTVAVQVQNGNPAPGNTYQYAWSSGQNTPVLFGIKAGTYTVTVTDLKLCTLVGKFTLHNPPGINVSSSVTNFRVSCPGLCDGAAQLTVSYIDSSGTSIPGTFNYAWSDNGPTDSVRTNLCAGVTMVTVTDNNNCSYQTLVSIDSLPALSATLTIDSVTCFGGSDGEAIAAGKGGNGAPFTYLWDNGSTLAHVTGLNALMDHTVIITDKNNCKDTLVVKMLQPDSIQVDQTEDNIDCFGGNTGGIALAVKGGNPGAYTFNWANQNNTNLGDKNPLTNLPAGTYSVTITDMKGCTATIPNIILSDPPAVQGTILPWEELLCHGDETTLNIDSIFGGSGAPYQYSLDFGVYLDKDFPVTMGGGEHFVTFIDRLGCEYTDTIFVTEPDPISVTFDSLAVEIELGDSIQLIPIVTGAVVDSFTWTPPQFLSNPDTLEPYTNTFASQLYTIVVFDEKGCSATGSVQVNIDPNRNVYVPNAFIPGNPKGIDDHFNPLIGRGVEIVNYMRVFDRWGNQMYERTNFLPDNNDFAQGWDGKYKGQYVMPGVYVYAIEVKFLDNRILLYRGDVTVIR